MPRFLELEGGGGVEGNVELQLLNGGWLHGTCSGW